MEKIAVYPGTFDPITNGHIDLIERGLEVFDRLIVAVAISYEKNCLFSVEERVEMIKSSLQGKPGIKIDTFQGLLIEYLKSINATVILRGLRAVSDFEYEFQMALMNRKLYPKVETFFMMTGESFSYLSSRIVKEISSLGGDVGGLVPSSVLEGLNRKYYL